jgi:hypothetical protein
MSLATVIRLEFAYPGVGILAGDSIQYLTIATAHGVIMVFFMIMPAIFGAFGNFLLPTQLGVHDVAFPRLNSAAFWFLPGGLIMLCQLVCVDRRYQRMNSFNIRELQSILQRRFFTDLVNTSDHRDMLESLAVTMRFKANSNDFIRPDQSLFYNFGLNNISRTKLSTLLPYNYEIQTTTNSTPSNINSNIKLVIGVNDEIINNLLSHTTETNLPALAKTSIFAPLMSIFHFIPSVLQLSLQVVQALIFPTTYKLALSNAIIYIQNAASTNVPIFETPSTLFATNNYKHSTVQQPNHEIKYLAENHLYLSLDEKLPFIFSESAHTYRFTKFHNPLINYDYKCGHYLTIWDQLYPQLAVSLIEVSRGIRKAP